MTKVIVLFIFLFLLIYNFVPDFTDINNRSEKNLVVKINLVNQENLDYLFDKLKRYEKTLVALKINETPSHYNIKMITSSAEDPFFLGKEKLPPIHFKSKTKTVDSIFQDFSFKPIYNNIYTIGDPNFLRPVVASKLLNEFNVPHLKYEWAMLLSDDKTLTIGILKEYSSFTNNVPISLRRKDNYFNIEHSKSGNYLNVNNDVEFQYYLNGISGFVFMWALGDYDGFIRGDNFYSSIDVNGKVVIFPNDLDLSFYACDIIQQSPGKLMFSSKVIEDKFKLRLNIDNFLKENLLKRNEVLNFVKRGKELVDSELKNIEKICFLNPQIAIINHRFCDSNLLRKYAEEIKGQLSCSEDFVDLLINYLIENHFYIRGKM